MRPLPSFVGAVDPLMEQFNASIDFDKRCQRSPPTGQSCRDRLHASACRQMMGVAHVGAHRDPSRAQAVLRGPRGLALLRRGTGARRHYHRFHTPSSFRMN